MSAATAMHVSHWMEDRALLTRIEDGALTCTVRTSEMENGAGIVSEVTIGGRTARVAHTSCRALTEGFSPARAFIATHHDEVVEQVLAGRV